ncbi:MAG: PaaI family thioesterase [Candidatus Rokuibacteriota bacterium]
MAAVDGPVDPQFAARVRESFARFTLMGTIGARLARVAPGEVDIELPSRKDLTQQHGFMAAGILTTVVDTACGYAAMSLMPADRTVLTVEYKVNLLAPAVGDTMIARARVVKPGRTLTVCAGDVFAVTDGKEKVVATMLATLVAVSLTEPS